MNSSLHSHLTNFEFVDPAQISSRNYAPVIESNQQSAEDPFCKENLAPNKHAPLELRTLIINEGFKTTPAEIPYDGTDLKTEFTPLNLKSNIKLEEIEIKEEAIDEGDHSYVCDKINVNGDHCYAKSGEQEVIDLYMQLWARSSVDEDIKLDDYNPSIQNTSKIVFCDAPKAEDNNQNSVETVTKDEPENLTEVTKAPYEAVATSTCGLVKNQSETFTDLGQKQNWQVDLKTLLEEPYLKERGFPVSKNLPLQRPGLDQTIESHSDCNDSHVISESRSYDIEIYECGNNKIYKCNTCNYRTTQKVTIKNHLKLHSRKKWCKCPECDYKTIYKWNLDQHLRLHTGEEPYKCSACDFSGMYKYRLIKHLETHADESRVCKMNKTVQAKSFKCASCDYSAKSKNVLIAHMQTHTGKHTYKCIKCSYSATTTAAVNKHMKIHGVEVPYKCSECNYTTRSSVNLLSHIEVHQPLYKCDKCNHVSDSKSNLQKHSKVHTEKTILRCHDCGYTCEHRWELSDHMQVHFWFKCGACGHRVSSQLELQHHMRVHAKSGKDVAHQQMRMVRTNDKLCKLKHLAKFHMRTVSRKPSKYSNCDDSDVDNSMLRQQ